MRIFATGVVLAMGIATGAQASDKILATWSDGWYVGTVTERQGGGLHVIFDDGGEATVPPSGVRPLDWGKGVRVQCNWKGEGRYFWGVISDLTGSRLAISYDDGDRENTTLARCRIPFKG